jgi:hypothetical protein
MTAAALPHMKERGGRSRALVESPGLFLSRSRRRGDGGRTPGQSAPGLFPFWFAQHLIERNARSPPCRGSSVAGLRTCSCTAALPAARAWPLIAHHDRRRVSHRAALQPQASHTAAGHRKVQLASATNSSGVALSPAEP